MQFLFGSELITEILQLISNHKQLSAHLFEIHNLVKSLLLITGDYWRLFSGFISIDIDPSSTQSISGLVVDSG